MANLMIARPQAAPSAETPKLNPHALPADVKVTGKNAAQVKEEAKDASNAFEANLKEGLSKEAQKDEAKKAALEAALLGMQAPVLNAQTPVKGAVAQVVDEAKSGLGKGDAKAITAAKAQVTAQSVTVAGNDEMVDPKLAALTPATAKLADPKLANAKEALIKAELEGKGEQSLSQANAQTQVKNNLNPLQQIMLQQQTKVSPEKGVVTAAALPQALQAMAAQPEIEHDFEVESLDVKGGAIGVPAHDLFSKEDLNSKRTPTSKVSTSDYLNLRDLAKPNFGQAGAASTQLELGTAIKAKDGKKDKLESLTGREAFTGMMANRLDASTHAKVIDAPVTQGTANKNVLSHDAIQQMTQQVNLLNKAQQDGEIKIRLRPDHLGELQMSVKSQGQQVSIEIRAQNSESKKIIEESLATLKDSLSQQNLSLARVDIVSAPTQTQTAADQGMQMDMSQFRQNSGQSSGRDFDQNNDRSNRLYEEMNTPVNLNAVRRTAQASARGGQGLDLIA